MRSCHPYSVLVHIEPFVSNDNWRAKAQPCPLCTDASHLPSHFVAFSRTLSPTSRHALSSTSSIPRPSSSRARLATSAADASRHMERRLVAACRIPRDTLIAGHRSALCKPRTFTHASTYSLSLSHTEVCRGVRTTCYRGQLVQLVICMV